MSHFSTSLGGVSVGEDGVRTDWAPLGAAAGDQEAAIRLGMAATIFHWGLHPWAIYAVVALALALFSFNKGLPLTIRSAFYPILGDRVWGWWGHVIDTLAVFATLFGLATSLGFGATQANAGLNHLFGIPIGNTTEVILISVITAIALISVVRGLDGGVKILSEINMGLAFLLLAFTLIAGPTIAIMTGFADYLAAYVQNLPALSNPLGREDVNFSQGWTSFYWAWWISWSPFVGMFIARVSRGRTVREFVICVLLIPSLVSVLWMSVFGGVAIQQVVQDGYTAAQDADLPLQLFLMLEETFGDHSVSAGSIEQLLRNFLQTHEGLSTRGFVQLDFEYSMRRAALKSSYSGWKSYPVSIKGTLCEDGMRIELSVEVPYSSTCPCSAALSRQLIQEQFRKDFEESKVDTDAVLEWLGTEEGILATPHSQRSIAQVRVLLDHNVGDAFPITALIDSIEGALKTPVQTAVKRVDEQEFALLNLSLIHI